MSKKEKKTILKDQIEQQQTMMRCAEREIYENISQCLCLARLQLGSINFDSKDEAVAIIGEANLLIGKAVKDLRNLAKQLTLSTKKQD
ncbi:MAG: hypothetical protein HOP10_16290 [Chitinophagaceae bacterium]|nr:hypothetical protein [Chitinophagaceae bacterium]